MISKTLQLSNSFQTHYLEQGAGEVLLLIHGVGMQAEAWFPQIEHFSKQYRVIAVDMPGHGQSNQLEKGSMLPSFVAWTIEFIEALNLGAVNLMGHSMGSLIATGVCVERPDLVKRLAVLNGVYKREVNARAAVVQRWQDLETGIIDIEAPLSRWFDQTIQNQQVALRVKNWLSTLNLTGYATAYAAFAHGDDVYADHWSKVLCPALVLTGELDGNSTPEMTRAMASLAPKGNAVVIENERHMVNLTAPEKVNLEIQRWLDTPI